MEEQNTEEPKKVAVTEGTDTENLVEVLKEAGYDVVEGAEAVEAVMAEQTNFDAPPEEYDFTQSRYYQHAMRELKACGYTPLDQEQEDGPNKWIQENLLELLEVFGKQGHSGFSANYCIAAFQKLAAFEPLCPLNGDDDEWVEIGDGKFQNKRCSHVFKDDDEQAYDINGIVWQEEDGGGYTNFYSRVNVEFPYTPKTEYKPASEDPGRQETAE